MEESACAAREPYPLTGAFAPVWRSRALVWILPAVAGVLGGLALLALYLGLVIWAQGFGHARELLWQDRYFVAAIAGGFGAQAALYTYVRMTIARARLAGATGFTAAGTGTSTAAMVACCAHHVADALPLLGLSAAAIFLNEFRLPIMGAGIAMNALGVAVLARIALRQRRIVSGLDDGRVMA